MEGAAHCDVSLQHELLACLRACASPPEGMLALVQVPLLQRLGAPEPGLLRAHLAEADERARAAAQKGGALRSASDMLLPVDAISRTLELGGLRDIECLPAAAQLARFGNQEGPKHGCVIVTDSDAPSGAHSLLGVGFNHRVSGPQASRQLIHAEVHAIVNAIRVHGAAMAFASFRRSTAWVVELVGQVGYDESHPCIQCHGVLRAVGMRSVRHSTCNGRIAHQLLGPPRPQLLTAKDVCNGLYMALRTHGVLVDREQFSALDRLVDP